MKKIYIILVTIVTLGMTSSCSDYLSIDKYVNDMLTLDTVFLRKNYTEEWLWNTYSYLNNAGAEIANKGTNCFSFASDEAIFGDWCPGVVSIRIVSIRQMMVMKIVGGIYIKEYEELLFL